MSFAKRFGLMFFCAFIGMSAGIVVTWFAESRLGIGLPTPLDRPPSFSTNESEEVDDGYQPVTVKVVIPDDSVDYTFRNPNITYASPTVKDLLLNQEGTGSLANTPHGVETALGGETTGLGTILGGYREKSLLAKNRRLYGTTDTTFVEREDIGPQVVSAGAKKENAARKIVRESSPDAALGDAISKLAASAVHIQSPKRMMVDETKRVKVRLGLGVPEDILKFPAREGRQVTSLVIKTTRFMRTTLSGPSFAVKEISPPRQMIAYGAPTEWEFDIKAVEPGDSTFTVSFWLVIKHGEEVEKMVLSQEESISVDVRPPTFSEWMKIVTENVTLASNMVTTVVGFLSLVAGIFINQVWRGLVASYSFLRPRLPW